MSTQHSPPGSKEDLVHQELKLNEVHTKWRKMVMKIITSRIQILRSKLPKEAVTAIVGQTVPERAWERLDELYGNKEMSVITALKRLRSFKCTKSAPHDQVVELVTAVQRCRAVLEGLGEIGELYSDRETIASVVRSLPSDSCQRWYHRQDAEVETPYQRAQ